MMQQEDKRTNKQLSKLLDIVSNNKKITTNFLLQLQGNTKICSRIQKKAFSYFNKSKRLDKGKFIQDLEKTTGKKKKYGGAQGANNMVMRLQDINTNMNMEITNIVQTGNISSVQTGNISSIVKHNNLTNIDCFAVRKPLNEKSELSTWISSNANIIKNLLSACENSVELFDKQFAYVSDNDRTYVINTISHNDNTFQLIKYMNGDLIRFTRTYLMPRALITPSPPSKSPNSSSPRKTTHQLVEATRALVPTPPPVNSGNKFDFIVRIAHQIINTLKQLHFNNTLAVYHHDIKPENILYQKGDCIGRSRKGAIRGPENEFKFILSDFDGMLTSDNLSIFQSFQNIKPQFSPLYQSPLILYNLQKYNKCLQFWFNHQAYMGIGAQQNVGTFTNEEFKAFADNIYESHSIKIERLFNCMSTREYDAEFVKSCYAKNDYYCLGMTIFQLLLMCITPDDVRNAWKYFNSSHLHIFNYLNMLLNTLILGYDNFMYKNVGNENDILICEHLQNVDFLTLPQHEKSRFLRVIDKSEHAPQYILCDFMGYLTQLLKDDMKKPNNTSVYRSIISRFMMI